METSKIKELILKDIKSILLKNYNNQDEDTFLNQTATELKLGVGILRLKNKTDNDEIFLKIAKKIKQICLIYNTLLIIDSRYDIATLCDADGIHINENDLPINEIKKLAGEELITGQTVNKNYTDNNISADYICLSDTTTKDGAKIGDTLKNKHNKIFIKDNTSIDNTFYINLNTNTPPNTRN